MTENRDETVEEPMEVLAEQSNHPVPFPTISKLCKNEESMVSNLHTIITFYQYVHLNLVHSKLQTLHIFFTLNSLATLA